MSGLLLPIDHPTALDQALQLLQTGNVLAFPTDTVYGVGAAGLDAAAVSRLFVVKERPLGQAIPLLLADPEDLGTVCPSIPPLALDIGRRYWPGALTLIIPAAPHLPASLLGGGSTVAVRVPDHPWLRHLIRRLGQPLAATSANLHGAANPRTAADVSTQLGARLSLILDGGPTAGDIPSTIVDVTMSTPRILRQGALTLDGEWGMGNGE
jgi:L-threonylcarbamoyladenylate synthase